MKYTKQPSMIKSNARFRGPTETVKYGNTINETLHDVKLLGKWMDRDEFIFSLSKGQSDFIKDNFSAYFSGGNVPITSNTSTAANLFYQGAAALENINLNDSRWTVYGNAMKATLAPGYRLSTPGVVSPTGIQTTISVQEGQILYFRMKALVSQGTPTTFSIGSRNVNQGEGMMTEQTIEGEQYFGAFIVCQHKETITINIDLYSTGVNQPPIRLDLSEISLTYVDRNDYHLQPFNSVIKSKVNILGEEIQNIIDNL